MMAEVLRRAALEFPDHPFVTQELTVTFICWIAHIQNLVEVGLLSPPQMTPNDLQLLWQHWELYLQTANATQQELPFPAV